MLMKPSIFISLPDTITLALARSMHEVFKIEDLAVLSNQQAISMLLKRRLIKAVHTFEIGDTICSMENVRRDIPIFFSAGDHDVKHYSGKYWPCGKKRLYYVCLK